MLELTKSEKHSAKELLKRGILRRHAQWQQEMRDLLDSPLEEGSNEFDRSMLITAESRKFYKEAMKMEDYYRNSMLIPGLACLYQDGYLTSDDLAELPERLQQTIHFLVEK